MRALHGSTADIQRRRNKLFDSECLGSNRSAHDVYYRVYRSNFVEVDRLNRNTVNLRFRGTELLENGDCGALGRFADAWLRNDLANFGQVSTV